MTDEKSYLVRLIQENRDAMQRTSDTGWRMAHQQQIDSLTRRLEREIEEEK